MKNVYWTLGKDVSSSYEEFIEAVGKYNQNIAPDRTEWNPELVVCTGPVTVVYKARWKDEDDTLQIVVSTAEEPLTMGRLLFTVHNESIEFFRDAPRRFFEGLGEGEAGILILHVGS